MAASQSNVAFDNTNDTTFRTWAGVIEAALLAGGWSVETQTGQANLTTMTRGSAGTFANFKIYKSPTISGLNSWYLKIEFGSGTSGATYPQFRVSMGWGTDGAGGLTTSVSTIIYAVSALNSATGGQNADTTARKWWFSVSDNGVFMAINTGATSSTHPWTLVCFERSLNSSVAQQDEIIMFIQSFNSSIGATQRQTQVSNRTSGIYPLVSTSIGSGVQYGVRLTDTNSLQSGNVGLSTIAGQRGGFTNDMRGIVGCFGTNLGAAETQIQFSLYGTNTNFVILGTPNYFYSTSHQILMRYE